MRILVDDSGPGIEPAARERVFRPFFTVQAQRHRPGPRARAEDHRLSQRARQRRHVLARRRQPAGDAAARVRNLSSRGPEPRAVSATPRRSVSRHTREFSNVSADRPFAASWTCCCTGTGCRHVRVMRNRKRHSIGARGSRSSRALLPQRSSSSHWRRSRSCSSLRSQQTNARNPERSRPCSLKKSSKS